jgi:hypothetical protein
MYPPATAIRFAAILGVTPKLLINSVPRQRNSTLATSSSKNAPAHPLPYLFHQSKKRAEPPNLVTTIPSLLNLHIRLPYMNSWLRIKSPSKLNFFCTSPHMEKPPERNLTLSNCIRDPCLGTRKKKMAANKLY